VENLSRKFSFTGRASPKSDAASKKGDARSKKVTLLPLSVAMEVKRS
jgi:hypothetical protein